MTPEDLIERKQKIQAALEKLPIAPGNEALLDGAVGSLTAIDTTGPGTTPQRFVDNERKSIEQLEKLQELATALADYIDKELNQSAILAMGGWNLRLPLVEQLRNTSECAGLGFAAEKKRLFNSEGVNTARPLQGGQPKNARALAVAQLTLGHFFLLTGKEAGRTVDTYPDRSRAPGQYVEVLKAIFEALGLKENAEHFARQALALKKTEIRKRKASQRMEDT